VIPYILLVIVSISLKRALTSNVMLFPMSILTCEPSIRRLATNSSSSPRFSCIVTTTFASFRRTANLKSPGGQAATRCWRDTNTDEKRAGAGTTFRTKSGLSTAARRCWCSELLGTESWGHLEAFLEGYSFGCSRTVGTYILIHVQLSGGTLMHVVISSSTEVAHDPNHNLATRS